MAKSRIIPICAKYLWRPQVIRGVQVMVGLSPYDIPASVELSRDGSVLHVSFRYLDHEQSVEMFAGRLRLGRHSGRVLSIIVEHADDRYAVRSCKRLLSAISEIIGPRYSLRCIALRNALGQVLKTL